MKIRGLLMLGFIGVTLIPVAFLGVWPHSKALQLEEERVSDQHLLLARHLKHALERYYRDLSSVFDLLVRIALGDGSLDGAQALMRNLGFRHVCVARFADGIVIRSLGPPSSACPPVIPAPRLEVLKSSVKEGVTSFTGVLLDPDGNPAIYLVHRRGDNLVVGAIRTDYFRQLGKAVAFGQRGHAAIVDRYGHIIAHPKKDWVLVRKDISKVPPVRRMMNGETGISKFYSPALKHDMIAGFTAVSGPGWGVMIPQPFAELEEKAQSVRVYTLAVIMGGLVAALAIAWVFSGYFVGPVSAMAHAAGRLAAGDHGARVGLDAKFIPAELRKLLERFNAMAETIERNHEELAGRIEERTKALSQRERDLRMAKLAEQAVSVAREEAEDANNAKSIFLANVSHELRTPLNAILGFSELIEKEAFGPLGNPKYRGFVKDISDSGQHLLSLINDLLDLSRIEAGGYELTEETIDIADTIHGCVTLVMERARKGAVKIVLDIPPDLPGLLADKRGVKQILINLLSNAVKFTQGGGTVTISARVQKDGIALQVADTGVGIAGKDIPGALLPFRQVDSTFKDENEGTGLGLPLSKSLAELHGGSLRLVSEVGVGTTVTVVFPSHRIVAPPARGTAAVARAR